MTHFLDPIIILAAGMTAVLLACIGAFMWLRDPRTAAPKQITRSVWCATNQRRATVEFVEEMKTGFVERRVLQCSLKSAGSHCHEDCCFAEPR
ncbi:MAG: hypothetical protein HY270_15225 [Deltaproteobacteria bacterium]|nr:hypothetical protein [Deltaproteobacteria bacterium]